LESILEDISQYFEFLKQSGQERFNLSCESKDIIDEWWAYCEGDEDSDVFIIDNRSVFFADEAGRLLIKILQAMNLEKESVCICDASLYPNELKNKIKRKNPKVIITLGQDASNFILNNNTPMEYLHGRFHEFCGIKVMPTWHPLDIIKDVRKKRDVWEDMKIVMNHLGL